MTEDENINSASDSETIRSAAEPTGLGPAIKEAASLFGVPPPLVLKAFIAVAGNSVGNSVKLRTAIAPGPQNLALSCVLCDQANSPSARTMDWLLQPIRESQDQNLKPISEASYQILSKELAKLEALQAKSGSSQPPSDSLAHEGARMRGALRPFVLIEDPLPQHLSRALSRSFDNALALCYSDAGLSALLDAGGNGRDDWQLLRAGFCGRTSHRTALGNKPGAAIVQPALALFVIAGPETLGRMFLSEDEAVIQVSRQLLSLGAPEPVPEGQASPGAHSAFTRLSDILRELLALRARGEEHVMQFCPAAERLLVEFLRKDLRRPTPSSASQDWQNQDLPLVAAKIAGISQLVSPERTQPISEELTAKSIAMAPGWAAASAKLAAALASQEQDKQLARRADKMEMFLLEMGKSKEWGLYKRFDQHPKHLMRPALDLLITMGRARRHADGDVEGVPS